MKPLESMIQRATPTSEPYAMVRATTKSSTHAPHTSGANHSDDIAPVQHLQSNGRVSDVLREATRVAVGLLPTDADELRELDMTSLGKAGDIVQRVVNDAATGNVHNLAFALKMQSEARADAFLNIRFAIQNHQMAKVQAMFPLREQLMTKSDLDHQHEMLQSSAGGAEHGLGASASSATQNDATSDAKTLGASPADGPDVSTPADVDEITINSLEDLKAYYAQYAADYGVLLAYIQEYAETDPSGCSEKLQTFASKYSAPLIVNAGIDPAYALVALGGDWEISEINLPGKGTFEAYRLDLASLESCFEDFAFCDRLQDNMKDAGILWLASAGWARDKADTPPPYSEVLAVFQKMKSSSEKISHVSVIPENLPDFYTVRPDPAGGYFVEPSDKFKKIVSDCDAYLAAWRKKYGGTPTDDQTFDQGSTQGDVTEPTAQQVYADAGSWLEQSIDNQAWLSKIIENALVILESKTFDVACANEKIDSLARSDAARYGGLKTTVSAAKASIIDPYGSLLQEYMQYVQSITDLLSNLSKYVTASGDGTTVNFKADDLKSVINNMLKEDAPFKEWSLTLPGTSSLSASDWKQELSGNFNVTQNADGTTSISLDLSSLEAMRDSLSNYSNGDISVTQYNAWYAGFTGKKDNVMNLSQSIAEKFSRMNSEFDNLVQLMSSAISALLESEEKYLQF